MIDLIASQDISEEEGLNEIQLRNFSKTCVPFDDSILFRFAKHSIKLQKLEISHMQSLPKETKQSMVQMIVQII